MPAKKTGPKGKTWKQVADELGVTPGTISKWRREEDGCPRESKNAADWQKWIDEEKSSGKGSGRIVLDGKEYTKQDLIDLKARYTEETTRKEKAIANMRELEYRMKAESLVPESTVIEQLSKVLIPLRRLLDATPRAVAAQANPENPSIAELALRTYFDDRVFSEIEKIYKTNEQENQQ